MKQLSFRRRALSGSLASAITLLSVLCGPSRACTIFVLTDKTQALFFNNEDWSNPKTRIWFVPGGEGFHGCAYLGFDNGWAQGGLNTERYLYKLEFQKATVLQSYVFDEQGKVVSSQSEGFESKPEPTGVN